MTPGQRWNALMGGLSYPMRVYARALGLFPDTRDLNGPDGHERMTLCLKRVHIMLANTDPSTLHVPPPQPIHGRYQDPFQPTHIGRKGGTLVEVMYESDTFVEFRTREDRSGCGPTEFRRLFTPLGPQLALFDLVGPHFLLDPLHTTD
jgi:hypothetical protein